MPLRAQMVRLLQDDFSGGIGSRISPLGARGALKILKDALNVVFRPRRAWSTRSGSRDTSTVALLEKPTSIGKHYASGGNRTFVGTDNGASSGHVYRHTTSGETAQTLPYSVTNAKWRFEQANGMLVASQIGTLNPPVIFATTNPADTWYPLALPKPGFPASAAGATITGTGIPAATTVPLAVALGAGTLTMSANATATTSPVTLTIGGVAVPNCSTTSGSAIVTCGAPTFNANTSPGSLRDGKTYYWRVRDRYAQGSSKSGPVSAGRPMTAPNLTANLNIPVPVSPRADYLGWTLERTDGNGDATGPFYLVADGTGTTYTDAKDDSELNYRTSEVIHGEPVAMDGVIFHKDRLFGWRGSNVYVSQPIVGEEATGLANWIGDLIYPLDKDDGDSIVGVVKQGDRLLFGKSQSIHVLEGDDVDSFRVRNIYAGAGFAGPRVACSFGSTVFFYGGRGVLFVARGDKIEPVWGDVLGDQLDAMDPTYDADVLALNWKGEYALFWHRRLDSTSQRDVLGYDLIHGTPIRFQGPSAIDGLVQVDGTDFGGATLLIADPVLRQPVQTTQPSQNPSFVTWQDRRSGSAWQIYIQSLDNLGVPRWTATQVSNSTGGNPVRAHVVGDGAGGCIVLFTDFRSGVGQIFAQRFNAAGVPQWTPGGILLESNPQGSNGSTFAILHHAVADGAGGAYYIFDTINGSIFSTVVQRINSSGAKVWAPGGQALSTSASLQGYTTDPSYNRLVKVTGGVVAAYLFAANTLRFSKLDATTAVALFSGVDFWSGGFGTHETGSNTESANGTVFSIAHDGAGGIVATATGTYPNSNIYAQRISSAGARMWGNNGTQLNTTGTALYPIVLGTGDGGGIFTWVQIDGSVRKIVARRLNASGVALWTPVPLDTTPAASQAFLVDLYAIPDGAGGAIISWYLHGATPSSGPYVARVDGNGLAVFLGTLVSSLARPGGTNAAPGMLRTDGGGGALLAWADYRAGAGNGDIYAQRISPLGAVLWASDRQVTSDTLIQTLPSMIFTDTPEAEYPATATPGYHVWAFFEGAEDFADSAGQNGTPIHVEARGHRMDGGLPQQTKDAEWIELYVNRGKGTFAVTVEGDDGAVATLSLSSTRQSVKYNSGAKYNDGSKYAQTGEDRIGSGLPFNTEGRSLAVTIAGDFDELVEVGGWALDAKALPQRTLSKRAS